MLDILFGIEHKPLDLFTEEFKRTFAEEIYCHIYCDRGDMTGDDWEKIFAACIGVPWEKNHSFYDIEDYKNLIAWSAKTVFYTNSKCVNLISGRNSPLETFKEQIDPKKDDPSKVGELILKIWNDRVLSVKQSYENFKTIVLLRNKSLTEFRIFYYDTELYDFQKYEWEWNKSNNLHAIDSEGNAAFLWQPKGSQFTITKEVPKQTQYLSIIPPKPITKTEILRATKFNDKSYVSVYG